MKIHTLLRGALGAGLTTLALPLMAQQSPTRQITTAEARTLYQSVSPARTSVHDPSIVAVPGTNSFYLFGSHMATARTTNLRDWTWVTGENPASTLFGTTDADGGVQAVSYEQAFRKSAVTEVKVLRDGAVTTVPFGPFDASAWNTARPADGGGAWTVRGNMWAPDVIYNPTMKKWCYYLSLNGSKWNSCVVLLTADQVGGPYVYQGPVVYSGFIDETFEGTSYRHTDLELVLGELSSLPARYNKGTQWGTYWPHAIDPNVFYDADGRLWLTYGSWSGGIYILELDEATGLRDYTVSYPGDYAERGASGVSDPYFGRRIAGGYYVSGEGPYVHRIGDYYYLFVSYGGYAPDGGYEMRIFRSDSPDGPYKDAAGNPATYTSYQLNYGLNAATNRGEKLMGAYNNWFDMTVGECAQGHNSVITADGRTYVVYHTKFNDGTVGHQVRVHQLYLNAEGWPVCAPFEYRGETATQADVASKALFAADEIPGTYKVLRHKYRQHHTEYEESTPLTVHLQANGTVTGECTGSWRTTEGTSFVDITLDGVLYRGVWMEQQMGGTTIKGLCFSAASTSGVNVWGCKMAPQYAVAYNVNHFTAPVQKNATVSRNLDLYRPTTYGATLQWTSDVPEVISTTGKYAPQSENVAVKLTATIACGDYYWADTYPVTAQREIVPTGDYLGEMVAYYDFNEPFLKNHYNTSQRGSRLAMSSGTQPELVGDSARFGKVLHQYFGYEAAKTTSYTRFPNPLKGATDLKGFTLSMWVKRSDDNAWDALCSFHNAASPAGVGSRLYLTGNSYVGFNDGAGRYFDINHPEAAPACQFIPVGEWALVTLTCTETEGCKLYVNGVRRANKSFASSAGTSAGDFDYKAVLDFVVGAPYLFLGYGSFWGSADASFDDLIVYRRELSATDVRALNTMCNRVTDFTTGEGGTGIEVIERDKNRSPSPTLYDLTGRKVTKPARGIYIRDGRKVLH